MKVNRKQTLFPHLTHPRIFTYVCLYVSELVTASVASFSLHILLVSHTYLYIDYRNVLCPFDVNLKCVIFMNERCHAD